MAEHVILMGDVIGSRKLAAVKLHEQLKALLSQCNKDLKAAILSPYTTTLGDEFQGIATSLGSALESVFYLEDAGMRGHYDFQIRYVIVYGEIETAINREIAYGMMGEGLTRARELLTDKRRGRPRFQFDLPQKRLAGNLTRLCSRHDHRKWASGFGCRTTKAAMTTQSTRYRTQWAAKFYAAAELTRRGYLVSLTFGNAPVSDLLVSSPNGKHFTVDVKGQSTKNFWLIQPRPTNPDHFFILVFLPKQNSQPQYFVISPDELMSRREEYKQNALVRGKYRDELGGINWSTALVYDNKWDTLPA